MNAFNMIESLSLTWKSKDWQFPNYSLAQKYSTKKVAGKFSRNQNSFVIDGLDVDPSHLLLFTLLDMHICAVQKSYKTVMD